MSSHSTKRSKGRPRGAAARANHDPAAHIASLGLKTEKEYGIWCRKHGFSGAVNKGWRERRQERDIARREGQEAEHALASAADLQSHIESLGLATTEDYRTWCRDRGLTDSLHKSANRRRKELEFAQAEKATAALTSLRRQTRKPRETIVRLFAGENGETLKADYLIRIRSLAHDLECQPQARCRFLELLTSVEKRGDLLRVDAAIPRLGDIESNSFLDGIAALARHDGDWLKAPAAWKAEPRNPRRQFGAASSCQV